MYKKAVAALVLAEMIFGVIFVGIMAINKDTEYLERTVFEVELNQVLLANEKEYMVEISKVMSSSQRILTYAVMDKCVEIQTEELPEVETIILSAEDYDNLLRIVEAEAGGRG